VESLLREVQVEKEREVRGRCRERWEIVESGKRLWTDDNGVRQESKMNDPMR
jgi:hypothetical protein